MSCGGGDEEGVEAVLDGAVGDGDRQVGLAAAGLAAEDQAAALGDEVGREGGAEQLQAQRRLVGEVEVVDGLEEREAGVARRGAGCGSAGGGRPPRRRAGRGSRGRTTAPSRPAATRSR